MRRAARARLPRGEPPRALAYGSGFANGPTAPTRNPPPPRDPSASLPRDGFSPCPPCLRGPLFRFVEVLALAQPPAPGGLIRRGVARVRRAARARLPRGEPPRALAYGSGFADGPTAPTRNPPPPRDPSASLPRDGFSPCPPCLRGPLFRFVDVLALAQPPAPRGLIRRGVASVRRAARARLPRGEPPRALAHGSGFANGPTAPTRNPPPPRDPSAAWSSTPHPYPSPRRGRGPLRQTTGPVGG